MKATKFLDAFHATPDDMRGKGYRAACPVHEADDGHNPSLIIDIDDEGTALILCQSRRCDLDEILDAVELTRRDLFNLVLDADVETTAKVSRVSASEISRKTAKNEALTAAKALVDHLDYEPNSKAAQTLSRRFGIDPATLTVQKAMLLGIGYWPRSNRLSFTAWTSTRSVAFTQGRAVDDNVEPRWKTEPNPDGEKWDSAGLVGTVDADQDVVIVEGLSDALTLAVLKKYNVVTVRGAAQADRIIEAAEFLEGKRVYIAADADPAGREYAATVADAIRSIAAEVRVANLPDGKDVGDVRMQDPATFEGRFDELLKDAVEPPARENAPAEEPKKSKATADGDKSSSTVDAAAVMRHIERTYDLFRSAEGLTYAVPKAKDAPKIAKELKTLSSAIQASIWRAKRKAPTATAVPVALRTAEGLAEDLPITELGLRSAVIKRPSGDAVQVDLGDELGTVVEITAEGWRVLPRDYSGERVIFRRTPATHPLPMPQHGGSRDLLREVLGLAEGDPHWDLIWAWLVAVWLDDVPRPILWATGPQGSGKSTRAKFILDLVDPALGLSAEPGKNQRDDSTAAMARYVPSWDNISRVSEATSDWFCRVVTGANIDARSMYTDDTIRSRNIKRAGIATSIALPYGLKPDALERLLRVDFPRMEQARRKSTATLEAEFAKVRPLILGALFDDLAGALANIEEVRADDAKGEARRFPTGRMADFVHVLHALDLHRGRAVDAGHAAAYLDAVTDSLKELAEEDVVLVAVKDLVIAHGGRWKATPGDMLDLLLAQLTEEEIRTGAPKTAKGVGTMLRTKGEALRAIGIGHIPSSKHQREHELYLLDPAELPVGEPSNVKHLGQHRPRVRRGSDDDTVRMTARS